MSASQYLQKAMLDWVLGGATPTQPAAFWAGLAVGSPGSISANASEMGSLTSYTRQTALFNAASTGAGGGAGSASCSNSAAMTFGPFSSVGSATGVLIWDASFIGSTQLLWFAAMSTGRTFVVGDRLVIGAGALTLTLT